MKTTSSVHLPLGYSAQVWVVIKGHLVNPSVLSSSFGRSDRIMDLDRIMNDQGELEGGRNLLEYKFQVDQSTILSRHNSIMISRLRK